MHRNHTAGTSHPHSLLMCADWPCCTHTRTKSPGMRQASKRSASTGSDNRMFWSSSSVWRCRSARQFGSPAANWQEMNTSRNSCPRIEWQPSPAAESPALKVRPSNSPGLRPGKRHCPTTSPERARQPPDCHTAPIAVSEACPRPITLLSRSCPAPRETFPPIHHSFPFPTRAPVAVAKFDQFVMLVIRPWASYPYPTGYWREP